MAYISINLLPIEFREEQLKASRFYRIQAIGISIILLTVFFASLTVALKILQSQAVASAQSLVSQRQRAVEDFKTIQASLLLLENRLKTVSQFAGVPSKQNSTYQDLTKVIPPAASISSLSIDKEGNALIVAAVSDLNTLDIMFTNMIDEEMGRFSEVSIESLSRARDGVFKVSLKLKPKE
ncbi:hypothetical protein HYS92_02330 [Candidatus Daviesbacteria bacterium]|nr:hypothetical protein [Candidatus Daviesbacteria bacterium]